MEHRFDTARAYDKVGISVEFDSAAEKSVFRIADGESTQKSHTWECLHMVADERLYTDITPITRDIDAEIEVTHATRVDGSARRETVTVVEGSRHVGVGERLFVNMRPGGGSWGVDTC